MEKLFGKVGVFVLKNIIACYLAVIVFVLIVLVIRIISLLCKEVKDNIWKKNIIMTALLIPYLMGLAVLTNSLIDWENLTIFDNVSLISLAIVIASLPVGRTVIFGIEDWLDAKILKIEE